MGAAVLLAFHVGGEVLVEDQAVDLLLGHAPSTPTLREV